MKCVKCQTPNNYYHSYCYNCGERLESADTSWLEKEGPQEPAGILLNKRREWFNPYRDKKRGKKRAIYAAAISVAAMALLILAVAIK